MSYFPLSTHIEVFVEVKEAHTKAQSLIQPKLLPLTKYMVVHSDWLEEYLSIMEMCKYTGRVFLSV
jgi:hypothetical protein